MNNKKVLYIIAIISIAIILGVVYATSNEYKNIKGGDNLAKQEVKKKKVYEHTFPKRISGSDFFKGEFISNDIVSIYPRRDALVRDILVDIGDEVKVGDTLAILFNPGVGGEGQSKINLKGTIVSTQENLLVDLEKVKEAKIFEFDQKIIEKEVILKETINNFNVKISQIGNHNINDNNTLIGTEYSVQGKFLENLQNNLDNAIKNKEELLLDSSNNIVQKANLLDSKIDEIYSNIIPILYIGNKSSIDYKKINTYDFSDYLGVKDTSLKNEFIIKLKGFNNNYDTYEVGKKYEEILIINNLLIKVLQNTIISSSILESDLSGYISILNTYNTILISEKEILDDSKNAYSIMEVEQDEKIENIQTNISRKENEMALLISKGYSLEAEKRLSVETLEASIETLKKSRDLLIVNEDKGITILKNSIDIATADLNSEYIKSGDYKIVSPFSGIIAKRGIDIGEKISQNIEAFRLAGVDNTLSRMTKKEIKFYVPENIKDNLEMNKEISFSLGDENERSFTGTIYRISPEIDEKTLSIIVQAKVDESIKLPNKSTIRVHLVTKENIFRIPNMAIYNKEDRKIVYYKKDNGKLGIRDVNIISEDGEFSLISGEFNEELKVVTTPIFIK